MSTLKNFFVTLSVAIIIFYASNMASANDFNMENEAVYLLNVLREEHGLQPLSWNPSSNLQQAAELRAMELKEYFSHTRPDGSSCFTVLEEFGLRYRNCGENIAYGTNLGPQGVTKMWINSPGHYKNMITPEFEEIGLACYRVDDIVYWVQLFFTRR